MHEVCNDSIAFQILAAPLLTQSIGTFAIHFVLFLLHNTLAVPGCIRIHLCELAKKSGSMLDEEALHELLFLWSDHFVLAECCSQVMQQAFQMDLRCDHHWNVTHC